MKRLMQCIVFAAFFWIPFYVFVRHLRFTETTSLIAVAVGVLPFLLLFFPFFNALASRVSKLKIAGVEFEFGKEVLAAVESSGAQVDYIDFAFREGRELLYGKANLSTFTATVSRYQNNPRKRVILVLDVSQSEQISLPMLLFQVVVMSSLLDLRAILFIDSSESRLDGKLIGALSPSDACRSLESWIGDGVIRNLLQTIAEGSQRGDRVEAWWNEFSHKAGLAQMPNSKVWLAETSFRSVFPTLERNVLELPLTDSGLVRFASFLANRKTDLVILVRDGNPVNVRTINSIAREIAESTLRVMLRRTDSRLPGGSQ